jgi:hypothetical protein
MEPIKIAIGLPTAGNVKIETVLSLVMAIQKTKNAHLLLCFYKGTYIHQLRSAILNEAREKKADYLMFVDSDVTFPSDGIQKLLDLNKDIIGGAYNMKSLPKMTTIKIAGTDGKKYSAIENFVMPNEPFKCAAIPTGFMLIKLDAIKDLVNPFNYGYREKDGEFIGEDVYFCEKAQEIGLDIWCDPTIPISHIGDYAY